MHRSKTKLITVPLLWLSLLFSTEPGYGQHGLYQQIELGSYPVGFWSEVIYNDSLPYNEFGYEGALPLFIQVWYPLTDEIPGQPALTFRRLRVRAIPDRLQATYKQLSADMDNTFVAYNVKEDFPDYNAINYGNQSYADVLNTLKTFSTNAHYKELDGELPYPVIVYHHGSQGQSDENFIMAEYFASRGYIFVSANFHLPFANAPYGLTEGVRDNTSSVKAVLNYAKSLTSNKNTLFIGHSWGAQVGWTFLHENDWANAFVSMETTIEFKTDTLEIMDKWPFVYDAIQVKKRQLSIPALLFANTQKDEPFEFFKESCNATSYFVSAKEEFGHESYTSGFLLRHFFNDELPQPDSLAMQRQWVLYLEHLKLIDHFFESVVYQRVLDTTEFQNNFYITMSND